MNAGASGAVFGLLGVLFVELFQFWQIVDRAYLELLKLTAFVVFLLTLGTLPYIDNMAHIGQPRVMLLYTHPIVHSLSYTVFYQECMSSLHALTCTGM